MERQLEGQALLIALSICLIVRKQLFLPITSCMVIWKTVWKTQTLNGAQGKGRLCVGSEE